MCFTENTPLNFVKSKEEFQTMQSSCSTEFQQLSKIYLAITSLREKMKNTTHPCYWKTKGLTVRKLSNEYWNRSRIQHFFYVTQKYFSGLASKIVKPRLMRIN